MELFRYFDRIYIVNLPERDDRRAEMDAELSRCGLKADSKHIRYFRAIRPDSAGDFPSLGSRGCFMSHLEILRDAEHDGLERILVLEDDLALDPRLSVTQSSLLDSLKRYEWDFAYLGHIEDTEDPEDTECVPHWRQTSAPIPTTHCYALNKEAIRRVRTHLENCLQREPGHPLGSPMHVDGAYSLFRSHNPEVLTLMAVPSMGGQRSSRSDIYPNKWFDRLPVVRQLSTLARTLKNECKRLYKNLKLNEVHDAG